MTLRCMAGVILIVGVGIGLVSLHGSVTQGQAGYAQRQASNYLPATAPGDAPEVAWMRELDSGLGGNLATDTAGNVYVWYQTGARVLKYDPKSKLQWDRSFASGASAGSVWSYVLPNLNGRFFLSRHLRDASIFSELLANGTLKNEIHLPRRLGLVDGFSAVDSRGGWISLDNGQSASNGEKGSQTSLADSGEFTSKEYLSRYKAGSKRKWSTYLGSISGTAFPARITGGSVSLGVAIDARDNSYVLQGEMSSAQGGTENCVTNADLSKFRTDGKLAWKTRLPLGSDSVSLMTVDRVGNIYLAGQHGDSGYYVGKFNTDGKQIWLREPKTYTGDVTQKMAVDKGGNIYIAGYKPTSNDNNGRLEAFLAKHDKSGRLLWRRVIPKLDMVAGLATYDGAVFLSGSVSHPQTLSAEMYLIRFGK